MPSNETIIVKAAPKKDDAKEKAAASKVQIKAVDMAIIEAQKKKKAAAKKQAAPKKSAETDAAKDDAEKKTSAAKKSAPVGTAMPKSKTAMGTPMPKAKPIGQAIPKSAVPQKKAVTPQTEEEIIEKKLEAEDKPAKTVRKKKTEEAAEVAAAAEEKAENTEETVREMYTDLQNALEKENEKRLVYEYPENDLEETKVIAPIPKEPKKSVVDKPLEKEEEEKTEEQESKNKLPIILAAVLLVILIALGGIYLLISNRDVKEVKVPDVVGLTTEKAIKEIEKVGLEYTTKTEESEEVEEGKVIRTEPKAGSTKTKGKNPEK